jgi:hypothetical protein
VLLRQRGQRRTVGCEQRLVRGDDMLLRCKCGLAQRARRALLAADQFHDDIGLAARERNRVFHPFERGNIGGARLQPVACGDGDELEPPPGALGQFFAMAQQKAGDAAADRSQPGDRDAERRCHVVLSSSSAAAELLRRPRNFFTLRAA